VQPDQWADARELLQEHGATAISSVPVVTARLAAIDGRPVDELAAERGEGRRGSWTLTREQRLTWLDALPGDNVIVEGSLWSVPERDEVSLEADFARDLGVDLGSTLTFDVQGIEVELLVTSLRRVEWRSFGINFFLVVEPGVLEEAPHFRLAAARLPEGSEQALQDRLAAQFPNVTLLRVRPILDRVFDLLGRAARGLRVLGGFTIAAGLAILAGAVAAGHLRRAREAALLKTLGVPRRHVALLFAIEHALVGLVAGAIGAGSAVLASRIFLQRALELAPETPWATPLFLLGGGALLACLAGLAASARALASPPLRTLQAG
jgi:putative ABC transport system permease protein